MKKNILLCAIIAIAFSISGCDTDQGQNPPVVNNTTNIENNNINTTPQKEEDKEINTNISKNLSTVFIPNETVEYMVVDTIESDDTAEGLVKSLVKSKDKRINFPDGTELLSLTVTDNTAYIDFNDAYYEASSQGELMYDYQVNSICASLFYNRQFGIDNIVFLRKGQATELIGPLYNEPQTYEKFDYNRILKPNKYYIVD